MFAIDLARATGDCVGQSTTKHARLTSRNEIGHYIYSYIRAGADVGICGPGHPRRAPSKFPSLTSLPVVVSLLAAVFVLLSLIVVTHSQLAVVVWSLSLRPRCARRALRRGLRLRGCWSLCGRLVLALEVSDLTVESTHTFRSCGAHQLAQVVVHEG